MNKILAMARDLHRDQSGASFIEYTVLLGVVLAVGITIMQTMGTSASNVWQDVIDKLDEMSGTT